MCSRTDPSGTSPSPSCLVIGIGNVLMGDEGVGVEVVRHLEAMSLPADVVCLDGGTGGFHLLEAFQSSRRVILVDAMSDDAPPGTVHRLTPRYSSDYPRTLTAHDIGLKDLLDAVHLLGDPPEVTLFAVVIGPVTGVDTSLSPEMAGRVSGIAEMVAEEIRRTMGG